LHRRTLAFGFRSLQLRGDDIARHPGGGDGVVHAVGLHAEAHAVAQDFAAAAAHIEHAHARPDVGQREGIVQAARQMRAFRFDEYVITLARRQEVFFRIERGRQGLSFCFTHGFSIAEAVGHGATACTDSIPGVILSACRPPVILLA